MPLLGPAAPNLLAVRPGRAPKARYIMSHCCLKLARSHQVAPKNSA